MHCARAEEARLVTFVRSAGVALWPKCIIGYIYIWKSCASSPAVQLGGLAPLASN